MLSISGRPQRVCSGLTRRDLIRAAGAGPLGTSLAQVLAATIFHALGIPPETRVHDALGRPVPVIEGGEPLHELFA